VLVSPGAFFVQPKRLHRIAQLARERIEPGDAVPMPVRPAPEPSVSHVLAYRT